MVRVKKSTSPRQEKVRCVGSDAKVVIGTPFLFFFHHFYSVHPPIDIDSVTNYRSERQEPKWHPPIRLSPALQQGKASTVRKKIFPSSRKARARLFPREKIPICNVLPRPLPMAWFLPKRSHSSLIILLTRKQSRKIESPPCCPPAQRSRKNSMELPIFRIASDEPCPFFWWRDWLCRFSWPLSRARNNRNCYKTKNNAKKGLFGTPNK